MVLYGYAVEVELDPPGFAFSEGGLLVRRAHHPELVERHVRRTD